MQATSSGWELKLERGPDGLVIQVCYPHPDCCEEPPLAEEVWKLLERHFVYRLVLELGEIDLLNSYLLGQLIVLHKRIRDHGGLLRLAGLSSMNRDVLKVHGLCDRFPVYSNREDAVMPRQPR